MSAVGSGGRSAVVQGGTTFKPSFHEVHGRREFCTLKMCHSVGSEELAIVLGLRTDSTVLKVLIGRFGGTSLEPFLTVFHDRVTEELVPAPFRTIREPGGNLKWRFSETKRN